MTMVAGGRSAVVSVSGEAGSGKTRLVSEALEEVSDADEEAAAREMVRRRLAATAGLGVQTRVRRLVGMLARKGYSGGLAIRVVRSELEAERDARVLVEEAVDVTLHLSSGRIADTSSGMVMHAFLYSDRMLPVVPGVGFTTDLGGAPWAAFRMQATTPGPR